MGTISLEHSDRLYWLGRYTERTFTTLKALEKMYDKMIGKQHGYKEYLNFFGLPDTYADHKDFFRSFLFDVNNSFSTAYSLERAYDNGIVLREEISTSALSFLQMAKDTLISSESSCNTRLSLLPLEDIMFGFWGCINEYIYDDEIRNIIYIGKTVEKLDLYIRMKYSYDTVYKEFVRLLKNLRRVPKGTPFRYNTKSLSELVEITGTEKDYMVSADKAVVCLEHLFEKKEVYA